MRLLFRVKGFHPKKTIDYPFPFEDTYHGVDVNSLSPHDDFTEIYLVDSNIPGVNPFVATVRL